MKKDKKAISSKVLQKFLKDFSIWKTNTKETEMHATFSFEKHVEALTFIARVTVHAEVAQHHPDILYTYKQVKVTLTTHDVKTLTEKDLKLAEKISSLY